MFYSNQYRSTLERTHWLSGRLDRKIFDMSTVMSDINMFHSCCNLCGLNSTSSVSEKKIFRCDRKQRDIFNFLRSKTHRNDNDNSSQSNGDREKDGPCTEVVLCNMCIKRIEVVSAMQRQVKFQENKQNFNYL